jgi:hypothetical protein
VRRDRFERSELDSQRGRCQDFRGRIDHIIDFHRVEVVARDERRARQQLEHARLQPRQAIGQGDDRALVAGIAAGQAHQLGQV